MEKRLIVLFCSLIVLFNVIFYRTYSLSTGTGFAQVAKNQSTYTLEVANARGMIYDCGMRPLVNAATERVAAVLPGPQSAQAMRAMLGDREEVRAHLEDRKPFAVKVGGDAVESEGVDLLDAPARYASPQPAAHLIGHLRDGKGVYGLEQAYDAFLSENSGALEVRYQVDAMGGALEGAEPIVTDRTGASRRGLVLTLDERIQRIAEYAAKEYVTKGAVVVMECETGAIKASVSLPEFDPNNLTSSFDAANTPFVNKALSPFNVGSSFKLVVTAAALEYGIEPDPVECVGQIDVGGQVFRCNNRAGHGWMDLRQALEQSCNPFFIQLARKIGAEKLRDTAQKFGFGRPSELAPGMISAGGYLPALSELQNPADVANFGFGQGVLMATPIQLAQAVSVLANGGMLVRPRLVEGFSDETGTVLEERLPIYAANRVIEEGTAARVRDLMASVVEEGSGKRAKPAHGGAGGKTASAQTGRYYDEARTNEIVEAWFVGYYPAVQPKYTIVVLAQGADSGSTYAAPIFKVIADALWELEAGEDSSAGEEDRSAQDADAEQSYVPATDNGRTEDADVAAAQGADTVEAVEITRSEPEPEDREPVNGENTIQDSSPNSGADRAAGAQPGESSGQSSASSAGASSVSDPEGESGTDEASGPGAARELPRTG